MEQSIKVQWKILEENGTVAKIDYSIIDDKTKEQKNHGTLEFDRRTLIVFNEDKVKSKMESSDFNTLLSALRAEYAD